MGALGRRCAGIGTLIFTFGLVILCLSTLGWVYDDHEYTYRNYKITLIEIGTQKYKITTDSGYTEEGDVSNMDKNIYYGYDMKKAGDSVIGLATVGLFCLVLCLAFHMVSTCAGRERWAWYCLIPGYLAALFITIGLVLNAKELKFDYSYILCTLSSFMYFMGVVFLFMDTQDFQDVKTKASGI